MGLLGASLVCAGISVPAAAQAAPPAEPPAAGKAAAPLDDLVHPLEEKRRELREQAVDDVLAGKAKVEKRGKSNVVKVGTTFGAGQTGARVATAGKSQYVELGREATDRIFVILAEFGDERHPDYPDKDTLPSKAGPARFDGPLHNQIPEPNRAVDNATIWQPDYNRDHFQRMYFGEGENVESLKTYYESQSSGRYSVDGTVTDWVKVRYNEARYGRSGDNPADANGDDPAVCADNVCNNVQFLVQDAANQWVADQKAAGRTDAQIKAELATFDVQDRYDFDGDGNFNEADGYLDHFQIVHAGGDESDGDPYQGEDAIWAHRSFVFQTDEGNTGPSGNLLGGAQVGNTGFWIGDYTMQPENGGLSVFAHEYGHDLGLPDDYDTAGAGSVNNGHWTLMAQSRLSGAGEPIGTRPGDLGAWNKMQLGWLDYEIVVAGQQRTLRLGPQEYTSDDAQAVVVVLPAQTITDQLGAPFAGTRQYWSGNANDLRSSMTRQVDLTGKAAAALTAKVRYNIEADYDYLYVQASANGQAPWTTLDGTVNGQPFPRDGSGAPALTGDTAGAWVDLNVPLNAYAGAPVHLRFLYRTDGAVTSGGFFADDIAVTADGQTLFTDGAEGASTFTLNGFTQVGASRTAQYAHRYIAGYRTYQSYDRYLRTGPYVFGYGAAKPRWVDHYPYQDGLLISYNNTYWTDNNTSEHPGQGRNLIIDANARPLYNLAGTRWGGQVQVYDAPFSLEKSDSFTLHVNGQPSYVRGQAAQPLFDDTKQFFYEDGPLYGVKLPAVGVKIRVLSADGDTMRIRIS
ncbi:immune inhibitor A domain-containing protein [Spirilliplanes yamanashiensis]|uniref:immune inhibitor A domain-containing protein n=1 Tax=Spirilliplanes yamanashiensis TaxID=42233 RepID=UPI00194F94FE|nr:immune inhibitor A domain-containing protein [Spirilliplanes yamanashiensis]